MVLERAKATERTGDRHNFGRRVERRGDRIVKPRTLFWERLVLSAKSGLRRKLDAVATAEGVAGFGFLPDLAFYGPNEVAAIDLEPVGALRASERLHLAEIAGRATALFAFLGLEDLHWENLALGRDRLTRRLVLAPLDVELALADLALPTETRLIAEADPELGASYRHAAGLRRILPFLGKPVGAELVVAMAAAYREAFRLLERHAVSIAEALAAEPELPEAALRVTLRGTAEYVAALVEPRRCSPPLLAAESEQLARGDIPYFFRLYGEPGIRYYRDASLTEVGRIPSRGDVPKLPALLPIHRGLRSAKRGKLAELGLFALIAAFDHAGLQGRRAHGAFEVTFGRRDLALSAEGLDARAPRALSAIVGSLYLPCSCGEVSSPLAPAVTRCG